MKGVLVFSVSVGDSFGCVDSELQRFRCWQEKLVMNFRG